MPLPRTTRNVHHPSTKLGLRGHPQPQMRIHPGMFSHPSCRYMHHLPPHLRRSFFYSFICWTIEAIITSPLGLLSIRLIHLSVHRIPWMDFELVTSTVTKIPR